MNLSGDQPLVAEPQFNLGPGIEASDFAPGRFANAIQRQKNSRHALQVIREEGTSSFILTLNHGGEATACRGWRYVSFNDGPQVHSTENIREQLGYRGRWEHNSGLIHVHLTIADDVCPRIGQYNQLVPTHSLQWQLRCLPIHPTNHSVLTMPALACQLPNAEPVFGEDEPHAVAGILPGRWIILGPGNGLRIRVTNLGGGEIADVIQVDHSVEPVQVDAWEHPF